MPILHELKDRILRIEISRPEKRNTLDAAMLVEFTRLLTDADTDSGVRCVFIHAQNGLFSAGGDLAEQLSSPSACDSSATGQFIDALSSCSKPIVACVAGPAVGLAVTLLYYCDLVYCSGKSLFSLPFTALGLTPRFGVSLLAINNAGYHKAAEKLLLSEPINAAEAFEMHLVSNIFEEDKLYPMAWARAQRLAGLPDVAVQQTKRVLRSALTASLGQQRAVEAAGFELAAATPDSKEACSAFLQGRKPEFSHKD